MVPTEDNHHVFTPFTQTVLRISSDITSVLLRFESKNYRRNAGLNTELIRS